MNSDNDKELTTNAKGWPRDRYDEGSDTTGDTENLKVLGSRRRILDELRVLRKNRGGFLLDEEEEIREQGFEEPWDECRNRSELEQRNPTPIH